MKKKLPIFLEIFTTIFCLFLFSNQTKAAITTVWQAPDIQIKFFDFTDAKCTDNGDGTKNCEVPWIGNYIEGVYKYAVGAVGIIAVVVMMWGGVLWITSFGSAGRVGEAKAWITGALTGLVLVMCSYTILSLINPNLVNFEPIKIRTIKLAADIPDSAFQACSWKDTDGGACTDVLGSDWLELEQGAPGCMEDPPGDTYKCCCQNAINCNGGRCKSTTDGECAVARLSAFGANATKASAICCAESSNGNQLHNPAGCTAANCVSIGLFQFNFASHCSASSPDARCGSNRQCCYDYYIQNQNNINFAVGLYSARGNWGDWAVWAPNLNQACLRFAPDVFKLINII